MRILHLYFQLHLPHQLNLSSKHKADLFRDAETFAKANETEYQPFFALLERNSQKFSDFKISLGVSGQWFDQAGKYDPELIQRLKKLINLGHVQLVALPYDFSLAWFYDLDEFEAQIKLFNDKIRDYFGVNCSVFAMPELIYNDKIARWAEQHNYSGMIIGDTDSSLDWRTSNRVYDAKGRKDLRLICQNTKLSEMILRATDAVLELEQKTGQKVFSLPKFQKELDLDFLRGNLVNLCLDTSIFRHFREQGIIKFFDELITTWTSWSQNRFYNALEVIGSSQPKSEISVKATIMRRNLAPTTTEGIELSKKIRYGLPEGLNSNKQDKFEELLYSLREQVQKTENAEIMRDFGCLTALDYAMGIAGEGAGIVELPDFATLSEILTNFGQKVLSMMPQPAKLPQEAGPGRVEELSKQDDFAVKVHRVKAKEPGILPNSAKPDADEAPDVVDGVTVVDESVLLDDEEVAIDKHARVEIDLAELSEAEVVDSGDQAGDDSANQAGNDTKTTTPKRAKRRRVVIE